MAGIMEIGGNLNPIEQAVYFSALGFGEVHKLFMDLALLTNHITTFTLQGQDMPQLSNYVDLDPEIVDA
jgi:hypothetical protein